MAVDLFRYFSRFEYALKAARYLTRDNGDATPDWDGFAVRVEERVSLVDDAEYRAAADYILTHPPKKQVVRDGALDWDDAVPGDLPPNQLTLLYVRRVRNNLFHGGKFNGHWFAPERSGELLRSPLVILRTSLEAEPKVNQAFAATYTQRLLSGASRRSRVALSPPASRCRVSGTVAPFPVIRSKWSGPMISHRSRISFGGRSSA